MSDTFRHLSDITNARTDDELWTLHATKMAEYGFDRVIYGLTRYKSGTSLGDPQDWVILTNHAPDYMQTFIDEGHYFHAPMLRWALENNGACSWRWMEEMARTENLTSGEQRVLKFNLDQNIRAGYTVSFRSVLLELTPATVEKHLRLARDALDVDTTAQAVLKAAFYNQMFVLDI